MAGSNAEIFNNSDDFDYSADFAGVQDLSSLSHCSKSTSTCKVATILHPRLILIKA
jgi:hypothetical protein